MKTAKALSTLTNWEANYRHGAVEEIASSVERFGFNHALRERGGVVYAGNHALKALRLLKDQGKPAPHGIEVKGAEWLIPCVDISHLSDEECIAFAVADNRLQEHGAADPDKLRELLIQIDEFEPGLIEVVGYTAEDLEVPDLQPINGEGGSGEGGGSSSLALLKWGKHSVHLTDEESVALSQRFDEHVEVTGSGFGFVRAVLGL